MYSNEAESANWDIYDDFKLKTEMVSMVYTKIFKRSNNLIGKPTFVLSLMYY